MENNPSQIPFEIFDWLKTNRFDSLNSSQQMEVLKYFTMQEFDEIHDVVTSIKSSTFNEISHSKEVRKQKLLLLFDAVHQKRSPWIKILAMPVAIWKATAVIFLVASAIIAIALLSRNSSVLSGNTSRTDTVFVEREIASAPIKITDTVYIPAHVGDEKYYKSQVSSSSYQRVPSLANDEKISILSIKEMDREPNKQRGNSMKEDSLLRRYTFVSM